jgi:hypothetical protein
MDDGRIKPDLVASGDNLYTSDVAADDSYGMASGTSLATPVVTGAVALLTQKYRQAHGGRDARGAEIKALLIQTAIEAGAEPGPDAALGYGLMDAQAAAELIDADSERSHDAQQLRSGVLRNGATETFLMDAAVASGTPIRVTLAWHDPAGAPNTGAADDSGVALVNDLDLVLIAPDRQTRFYPWQLDARSPAAAASNAASNHVDNVERVDVDAGQNVWTGRWSIEVSASGDLSPRGIAQSFGLASSEAVSAPTVPVLSLPRAVVVEVPFGSVPDDVSVPLENLGGGTLTWSRSEERRVGKECRRLCRSRWSPYH